MKTKLTELQKRITPLPWQTTGSLVFFQKNPGGRKTYIADSSMDPGANQTIANAAYLVHAANALPKLVEALEDIARGLTNGQLERGETFQSIAQKALADAQEVEI